jgi:hypothetical protein
VVAAEAADVAFDAAFLMCSGDAWLAVERLDVEMRAKCDPAVRLNTLAGEPDYWATAALRLS